MSELQQISLHGTGTGTNYDVLTIGDGMTVQELLEAIVLLPRKATLVINGPAYQSTNRDLRIPVKIEGETE